MKKIIDLFLTFFKIGLFTFGGGYAMISLIENECVNKKDWISKSEMKELIVISETTPGPIAINCSTFVGYKVKGFFGSVVSTIGVVLPSLIIILLFSFFLDLLIDNPFLYYIFSAMKGAVIILIAMAFIHLSKSSKKNLLFYVLLISAFIVSYFLNVKSIYIILIGIVASFIYTLVINKTSRKEETKND